MLLRIVVLFSISLQLSTTNAEEDSLQKADSSTRCIRSQLLEFKERATACIGDKEKAQSLVDELNQQFGDGGEARSEAVKMLIDILRETPVGPGVGWFSPAQQRYDWNWLQQLHGASENEGISLDQFRADRKLFERLDRDGSGLIEAVDLDWNGETQYNQQLVAAGTLIREIDVDHDGLVNQQEWSAFFLNNTWSSDSWNVDDLRRAIIANSEKSVAAPTYLAGDAPTQARLIKAFFLDELGSLCDGPDVGDRAPVFSLETANNQTVSLADHFGNDVTVLIFGNYTCGPFRRTYEAFDRIAEGYKDKAVFLGVYVREAHPSDGWSMEMNQKSGVHLRQPRSFEERLEVAKTCSSKLEMSLPLLVDTLDDHVGNLYSGMPSRAYVIDERGLVVYKSGRGPLGFKPYEMEQALILTLMAKEAK